jgi:diguanylate cyclase (GGDEF)-like protein
MPLTHSSADTKIQPAVLVDFPFARDAVFAELLPKDIQVTDELRTRLINLLQSTLDINELLPLFFQAVQQYIDLDGLVFTNKKDPSEEDNLSDFLAINIKLGSERAHQCHYRLIHQQEFLGAVTFSRKHRFTQDELEKCEIALSALIFPLRNALRYQAAVKTALIDPLTATGNRIALDNAIQRELQWAQRYRHHLSLLMIDIDHFKNINDSFGHFVGDQVLQTVAKAITTSTRQTDKTFRYGGEEFVVVLGKTDAQGAALIAERIRQHIASLTINVDAHCVQATVSIGVSTLIENEKVKNLFDRADQALYAAKNQGRNQVVVKI